MFAVFHLHKKRIVAACCVLVICIGCVLGMGLYHNSAKATGMVVAIDPGHGGYDGGVCGLITHVRESDINLSIALYLATYLRNMCYQVVLTRDKDKSPVEAGSLKRRDMDMRLAVATGAAADLLVSIHCNFYPSTHRRGVQVFYDKDVDLPLATQLQNYLNDACNTPTVGRQFAPLWGDYYLLAHAPCPAAIVECGFLSNPEDEALLTDSHYRMTLAYQIACAIRNHGASTENAALAW